MKACQCPKDTVCLEKWRARSMQLTRRDIIKMAAWPWHGLNVCFACARTRYSFAKCVSHSNTLGCLPHAIVNSYTCQWFDAPARSDPVVEHMTKRHVYADETRRYNVFGELSSAQYENIFKLHVSMHISLVGAFM